MNDRDSLVRPATFIESPRLSRRCGTIVTLASETFQTTGSFKFRAAYSVVSQVPQQQIIAASSGNFGQAIAYACQLLGKSCVIVMPQTSSQVKIRAVQEFGGTIELIDINRISRQARVAQLSAQYPDAYVASAYDDPLVINGNASLGTELSAFSGRWDFILAPVGGGGLTAGIIQGLRAAGDQTPVLGVEPLMANDAARSLRAGEIVANAAEPRTVADGVRTVSLGRHNWSILQRGLSGIIEVTEEEIGQALGLLFCLANLKAEPTGALGLAAVLHDPDLFRNRSVCCVVSGGNVDEETFVRLLRATKA